MGKLSPAKKEVILSYKQVKKLKMKERQVFDAYEEFGFCFFLQKTKNDQASATREVSLKVCSQNSFNLKIDMAER